MSSILLILLLSILAAILWQIIKKGPNNRNKRKGSTDPTDQDDNPLFDDWDENL
jgi:hypothetical protein